MENKQELKEFVTLSQHGVLSKAVTQFAEEDTVQLKAGYKLSNKLICRIEMDEKTIKEGEAFFAFEPDPPGTK